MDSVFTGGSGFWRKESEEILSTKAAEKEPNSENSTESQSVTDEDTAHEDSDAIRTQEEQETDNSSTSRRRRRSS